MSDLEPIEYKNSVKKLGDFITLRRGKTYKSSLLGKPGAFLIGLASIEREGGFRDNKLETYGGDCPDSISLKPGDLYVSLKDITHDGHLLGAVSRIPKKIKLGRLTQDTVKLIFDTDDFPKDYIYWLLRTPQYRNYCRSRQTGTTNLGLSREDFLSFPVPPLTEKTDAIIKSLEAIEGKIENLKQQNETLEKIAQTLFKHWFIDFEFPNDDGKPYKSSGGAMVASELGDIPAGWRVGKLDDYISIQHGYNFKSEDFVDDGNPIVRMGNFLINGGLDFHQEKTKFFIGNINQKFILQANDLVVALSDVTQNGLILGNPGFIPSDNRKYLLNQRVGKINIDNFVNKIFLYCLMRTKNYKNWVKNSANSTTVLNTSPSRIGELLCALPLNNELLDKLEILLKPIFFKNENNIKHIQTLTKTRDTLLPKLMSGQIRVKEVESIIEEGK